MSLTTAHATRTPPGPRPTPRPCLGACGAVIRNRRKSLPLCADCDARAWQIFRAQRDPKADPIREWNRFWGHAEVVRAALAGGC